MARHLIIHVADRRIRVESGDAVVSRTEVRDLPEAAATFDREKLAALVLDAVRALAAGRVRATLVLPSSWCYVHPVNVPQRRPSRTALAYALEEYLPVEIEQLTCDFLRSPNGRAIGVAIETERVRDLLAALHENGIEIQRILIDVLYAADDRNTDLCLLWCDHEHAALLLRKNGRTDDLHVVRLAPGLDAEEWVERVSNQLGPQDETSAAAHLAITGCVDEGRLSALAKSLDADVATVASTAQRRVRSAGDFDLARGALAPASQAVERYRVWRRLAAATLAALLVLCVGLLVQRSQLESQLDAIAGWEVECFRGLFPGQPVPAGVALRLASERRRLEGLTLSNAPEAGAEQDALVTLQEIVAALPADLRLDLQELRVEDRDITIRGRTRDHRQAERLTQAIDALERLQCAGPRTDRHRDGGVQFFAHARRVDGTDSMGKGRP